MSFAYGFGLPHWQTLSGGAFNPLSLFQGGVQGAFYDPSDPTVLFTDRAGTTPCGTPGGGSVVPVGLMLDKSQGLVLGSELVTAPYSGAVSGGFSITSTSVVRDGVTAGGTASLTLSTTLTANAFYQVTFTAAGLSGDNTIIRVGSTASGNFYRITTAGTYTIYLPAGGTAAILGIAPFAGTAGGITLTNISVRALAGNHAIAANDTTARPELRARVNLLERSEEFDNAYWTSSQGTIAANAGVAPNGTTTADLLTPTSTGTFRQRYRVFAASAISYSLSVYAKASGKTGLMFTDFPGNVAGAQFDLSAGTVTSTASGYTATIQAVGDGWYRCVMTATPTAGATRYAGICVTDNGSTTTGTLDGTNGILIWGAQLIATNEFPANTYQRIVDANTYDAVGFPRYFVANGTSSAMSTPGNVNLSGTDKVTVFAGVRKLSDAAFGMVAEFGNNAPAGSFWVLNGDGAVGPGPQWQFLSIGATTRAYATATATSPISNVFTGIGDINAPLSRLRLNGAQVANTTTTQGGGNYGTYPLFIGARNNASLFFTGNIYSLIVVGSAVSAGQISATEQWVAGKTGITI